MAAGALYGYSALASLHLQNQQDAVELNRQRARLASSAGLAQQHAAQLPSQLSGDMSPLLRDFHEFALQQDLTVAEARYTPSESRNDAGLARSRIDAKVRGSYAGVKRFTASLLAVHDGLALDSLSIRRGSAADPKLDVQLIFSLYSRTAP
ncbi:type 4a pilus biogenesis protein PilO [Duganella sp. CY15W]|uniref:type 4a pilus biogenesis protein PilO n=1 Tax=Duganella sp. CY15W TaxID=2692172 RepID=UPI001E6142D1|nr:type 4a pilus biogenesis protein PilO [Duganella sp. CY15W]